MAFEDTTFFEVHVHLPDEDDESPTVAPRTSRPEPETESKPFLTRGRKIAALAGASIVVSIVVSVAAKRLADTISGRLSKDEEESDTDEAEIKIAE